MGMYDLRAQKEAEILDDYEADRIGFNQAIDRLRRIGVCGQHAGDALDAIDERLNRDR